MTSLSWDLHIHPGRPEEGRWGDGAQVRGAAQRQGLRGFVWKSHSGKATIADCAQLPHSAPYALPSITLNHGVGADHLERAIAGGVRWIWGPSRPADQTLRWELSLPEAWPAMREVLAGSDQALVVATSHLGAAGRSEIADLARLNPRITCSATHSLYLGDAEVGTLAGMGAVFEADLYTMFNQVRDLPLAGLVGRAELTWRLGSLLYLTSDAGQAHTGDPYRFVEESLASLSLGAEMVEQLAVVGPQQVAARVFAEARAS